MMLQNYVRPSMWLVFTIGALLGALSVHTAAMQQGGQLIIVNRLDDTARIERCEGNECKPALAVPPRSQRSLSGVTNGEQFRALVAGKVIPHTVSLDDTKKDSWLIR